MFDFVSHLSVTSVHPLITESGFFSQSSPSFMEDHTNLLSSLDPNIFFLLTSLSNVALNYAFTLPCVMKFLDAYNAHDRILMGAWCLATVGMVTLCSLATALLGGALLGILFPLVSLLTPTFFISCAAKAALLLLTAVAASRHIGEFAPPENEVPHEALGLQ